MIAERTLQNIISEYNFDDLYGPYQPGGEPPRKIITETFCERLAAELEPLGIQLVGGGISDLEPANPQVYVQRVRSWQVDWTRKIMLKQAEGQAEWLRMVERARAEAQADLILNMGRQLEELSAARTELRPETALNLLVSILDELMRQQPTLGQILPGETLQVLTGIRAALISACRSKGARTT
jgi:regulator of protease activity HflC (stomatin/prohibitin superfamily)